MTRYAITIFVAQLVICGALDAEASYRNDFGPYEDFEATNSLAAWETPGRLGITRDVYKAGQSAMRWDFSPGNELTYAKTISGIRAKDGGMNLWIFNPVARTGPLLFRVQAQQDGVWRESACVPFYLDYVGWRLMSTLWTPMILKTRTKTLPGLRVSLVAPAASGWLAFDAVDWNMTRRPDSVAPDAQMPWSRWELHPDYGKHVSSMNDWMPMPDAEGLVRPETVSEAQRSSIRILRDRVIAVHVGDPLKSGGKWTPERMQKRMEVFRIQRRGKLVMGAPLQQLYADYPLRDGVLITAFGNQLHHLSRAWHSSDEAGRRVFEGMTLDLVDYVDQQGWAYGSQACGGFAVPFLLNRSMNSRVIALAMAPLQKIGRWERFARLLSWYNGLERLGNAHPVADPDAGQERYRGYSDQVQSLLPIILLGDDERKVCAQLTALSTIFSNGIKEQFAADGCAYAHGMHHPAYAYRIGPAVVEHAMMLEGTAFQLDRVALNRLLNAVYVGSFAAVTPNKRALIGNFRGRATVGTVSFAVDRMARAVAAHAARLEGHPQALRMVDWVAGSNQQGHVTMWNSSVAMHRRDDWVVASRGMGPWVKSMEIYHWTEHNNYANLTPYGSILFARAGDDQPPLSELEQGWNWNFMPGATSRVLPQHKRFGRAPRNQGYFFGANLNGNGVSGIALEGVPEVEANTSIFYFDRLLVCLGSDIKPIGAAGAATVTTLLQAPVGPDTSVTVHGQRLATGSLPVESGCVVRDGRGIDFVVPRQKNAALRASDEKQSWTHFYQRYLRDPERNPGGYQGSVSAAQATDHPELEAAYVPTEKQIVRLWLEHDVGATDGAYRYGMLIDGRQNESAAVLDGLERGNDHIAVLRQDSRAHVAACPAKGLHGAVFFEAGDTGWSKLPRVSAPVALMLEERDGGLNGSLYDPSRYPRDGAKAPSQVTLSLAGNWNIVSGATRVANSADQTTISVRCEHSKQSAFRLVIGP